VPYGDNHHTSTIIRLVYISVLLLRANTTTALWYKKMSMQGTHPTRYISTTYTVMEHLSEHTCIAKATSKHTKFQYAKNFQV